MQNENPQKDWWNQPYIDYLNAVDDLLEDITGNTSTQEDMADIAAAQEAGDTPAQFVQFYLTEHLR